MTSSKRLPPGLKFDEKGLIPAIVQDHRDDSILMMAFMNRKSLDKTMRTGQVHFWSRSRKTLWHKGATSGSYLNVKEIRIDCDGDSLLIRVEPEGPACHTGQPSCFFRAVEKGRIRRLKPMSARALILDRIYDVILDRKRSPKGKSYVSWLLTSGRDKILKKIGEESGELIIGSKNNRPSEIIWEVADLWFHTLVLLGHHNISPSDIYEELQKRFGKMSRFVRQRRT
ncbi:MAG TPA: bifunctional phosphoribosyl-AMP cyclohydrolase/phosphoribosyl-ATP diphosphatase HisIE [Nitrospiria bacterium]|jgi:phosphoribosyl-ATP pyrophosphohydrolase/phosphoribosyl-AMP cyclohydrolase|nr:bifunctional phosphoribosyl-AMP cyclohydrolase/phosphoribosyl-ATP diphosphatase HisIE [Nitrospiria bacterium]